MPPHCRTLEEMRALRRPCHEPPPAAGCHAACPPPSTVGGALACAAPPGACYAVAAAAPPAVVLVDAADAACAHFPYVCARTRPLHAWCRPCTHRRLFPEDAPCAAPCAARCAAPCPAPCAAWR